MIKVQDGELTLTFDSAADAAEYAAKRRGYRKLTCKDGAPHEGSGLDTNHCDGCGKCIHDGMC